MTSKTPFVVLVAMFLVGTFGLLFFTVHRRSEVKASLHVINLGFTFEAKDRDEPKGPDKPKAIDQPTDLK